jgi:hypothetical protein
MIIKLIINCSDGTSLNSPAAPGNRLLPCGEVLKLRRGRPLKRGTRPGARSCSPIQSLQRLVVSLTGEPQLVHSTRPGEVEVLARILVKGVTDVHAAAVPLEHDALPQTIVSREPRYLGWRREILKHKLSRNPG